MKLIDILNRYADPDHTGCFSFWHKDKPHIVYDLDAAEGVRFWSMNIDTDDLDEAQFDAATIFSDGWEIKIENGTYVEIQIMDNALTKVTAIPHFKIPELPSTVIAAQNILKDMHDQLAKLFVYRGEVMPASSSDAFQTIVLPLHDPEPVSEPEDEVQPSLLEVSDEVKKFLDGAIGCVEANSFERMSLYGDHDKAGDSWKDNTSGLGITLGMVAKMPVCISLNSAVVNDHKIIFYSATSIMVDWRMVTDWLKTYMPETAFKDERLNKVDAMNFHNVFPRG
jgi:hypothetical protein